MVTFDFGGLLVVSIVAFIAPLVAGLVPRRLVPAVVFEVLFGIVVGPHCLNLVRLTSSVQLLYLMGLGFLLFLSGQDIDPRHFRGPLFRVTGTAWLVSLALAFPVALLLKLVSPGTDLRLLALALTASAVGVIVPILRDLGEVDTEFGQLTVMAGSVGEFAPLLLLTILFSADEKSTPEQIAFVVATGVAALIVGLIILGLWRSGFMGRVLSALDDSASQLRVRGALVILLVFAGLTHGFGVDSLLGAFVAGVMLRLADRDSRPNWEVFQAKLDAIGFGFLIPVFFVVTGVQFDVPALFHHTSALELLPLLLIAFIVVRAAPALLYSRRIGRRPAVAVGFLQSATLTIPVVIAEIGESLNLLTHAAATALVGASLLSTVLFPPVALLLRPWATPTTATTPSPGTPAPDADLRAEEGWV